jgi:hypothetical protein
MGGRGVSGSAGRGDGDTRQQLTFTNRYSGCTWAGLSERSRCRARRNPDVRKKNEFHEKPHPANADQLYLRERGGA